MTGLTVDAASLPTDPCGAGSTLSALSGDSVLLLADGLLGAGGSCLFAVTLDVPIGAVPDTYLNTHVQRFRNDGWRRDRLRERVRRFGGGV